MFRKFPTVYVVVSGDVDYSEHHRHCDKQRIFREILDSAEGVNIRLSFYLTAREAVKIDACVRRLADCRHEIGCHGLIHDDEEEYNTLPYEKQFSYISEATQILSDIVGAEVRSFRAPRVKVSGPTYRVLDELGYLTDSSICSQRMDLISSNMFNRDWVFAPRLPYHPSITSPFKRGDCSVLIVPVSALIVPFISSVLYVFGLTFMKILFRLLYTESLATGKPIVYMYHPYEFLAEIPGKKELHSNIRVHGLRFRRRLYRGTPQEKFAQNVALWKYMKSFPGVQVVTMRQLCDLSGMKGV